MYRESFFGSSPMLKRIPGGAALRGYVVPGAASLYVRFAFTGHLMPLSDEHLAQLSEAKRLLENPGLAVKITNLVGKPIEKGFELLPDS